MGMFSKIFGGGNKQEGSQPARAAPPPPNPPAASSGAQPRSAGAGAGAGAAGGTMRTIQQMDEAAERLELRERVVQKKIDQETAKAKEYLAKKDKNRALLCMKNKKQYEDNLSNLIAQRANIDKLRADMEQTALTEMVVNTQRAATNEMARINAGMNPDQVEADRERLEDVLDDQRRIQEAITQPIAGDEVDEDELLDELNDLVMEEKKEKAAAKKQQAKASPAPVVDTTPLDLPTVPNGALPSTTQKADDDLLADLEGELGLAA